MALPAMQAGQEWRWTIRYKHSTAQLMGEVIVGWIPIAPGHIDNRWFWLNPQWQRQGIMTEACAAATCFWFEQLDQPVLRTSKAAIHQASRRISQKEGMRQIGTTLLDYIEGPLATDIWEITREEWRNRPKVSSYRFPGFKR